MTFKKAVTEETKKRVDGMKPSARSRVNKKATKKTTRKVAKKKTAKKAKKEVKYTTGARTMITEKQVKLKQLQEAEELILRSIDAVRYELPKDFDKRKEGRGRPKKMTTLTVRKLEDGFALDMNITEACNHAGIRTETYYQFIKVFTDFPDVVEQIKEAAFAILKRLSILEAVNNPAHRIEVFKRRRKKEWTERQEVAHSGEIANVHSVDEDTANLIKKAMGNFTRKANKVRKEKEHATAS